MEAVKPLIFVHPLSPTLKKLKEASEQNAEAEGVEIYEIDDIQEFNQLFPTVGQSVCLFSDPKKCAKALQANKKTVKTIHSKVILISAKKIQPKTLQKFDKVGLTECITEPVAPKTLMYKVRLQLRSIKAQTEEEDDSTKSFGRNNEKDKDEQDNYYRGKGHKEEEEQSLDYRRKSKSQGSEESEEQSHSDYDDHQKTHWKGKVNQEEQEETENKKKEPTQQESIDSHYKGKVKNDHDEEVKPEREKEQELDLEEDPDLAAIKKSITAEVEQEASQSTQSQTDQESEPKPNKEKKKETDLDVEEENETEEGKNSFSQIDSHMKGSLKNSTEAEAEKKSKRESSPAPIENGHMRGKIQNDSEDEDENKAHRSEKLDLDIEPETSDKEKSNYTENHDGHMKGEVESSGEKEKAPQRGDVKSQETAIEKHMSGDIAPAQAEEGKESSKRNKDMGLEIQEEDQGFEKSEADEGTVKPQPKKDHQLDLEDEEGAAKKKAPAEKEEYEKKEKDKNSHAPEVKEQKERKTESEEKNKEAKAQKEATNETKESEDSESSWPKKEREDEKKSAKRQTLRQDEDKKKRPTEKADSRADKLNSHYKGTGNSHEDQDWDNLHGTIGKSEEDFGKRRPPTHANQEFEKSKAIEPEQSGANEKEKNEGGSYRLEQEEAQNAGELIYAEDEYEEQTIDYAKLKDEYGAMPYAPKKKKKISTEYQGKEKAVKSVSIDSTGQTKSTFDMDPASKITESDSDNGEDQETQIDADKINVESHIFDPEPCGLDEVIRVLSLYHQKDYTYNDFLLHLSKRIHECHQGLTSFYSFKQDSQTLNLEFCPFDNMMQDKRGSELHDKWEDLKAIKLPFWQQMKLPAWSDHNFQESELDFYYPYFDEGRFMGFSVVYFNHGFKEFDTGYLEVMLESARGFYREHYAPLKMKHNTKSTLKEVPSQKKRGFLSRLLDKMAS